jgi:polyphosphate kinase 2 (PPK2 family)
VKRKRYGKDLRKLQVELCRLQAWVKRTGYRAVVVFEGRDTAGKGGMAHFPAAGEIVIFDRSWYNRAGIEHVMGFCSREQYESFLDVCPMVERLITRNGIQLIKIWLEVGQAEQERRMLARVHDPLRQWKLSPMDIESWPRWYEYSRARDRMFAATDTKYAPWVIVPSDDKRRARLNCIAHILGRIPYKAVRHDKVKLPRRSTKHRYDDAASLKGRRFVTQKY